MYKFIVLEKFIHVQILKFVLCAYISYYIIMRIQGYIRNSHDNMCILGLLASLVKLNIVRFNRLVY